MAEVPELASLASVICCGLKLSISLYEFATSLGEAGREIKSLGTDITLFCSVLKQVQTTLGEANNAFRISINAMQTTQDILDQSSGIFDELVAIFAKLQKDENIPVDFLTRVRWTFRRAKVLLLRESLHSCTEMLHLMLSTMSFAQRIATRGTAFHDDLEDEAERALTHSLCLAQQTTNERLEELKRECLAEESERSESALTKLASEEEYYQSYSPEEGVEDPTLDIATSDAGSDSMTIESGVRVSKITSLLLGTILEQQESTKQSHRMTWTSVSSQRQSVLRSDQLLRNWTDQYDPLAWDCKGREDDESILPSDSISTYHARSRHKPITQKMSTFFESATSTSDLGGADAGLSQAPTVDENLDLTRARRADDAAFRSRQKVAKLTGEDYTAITADWMWRTNEQNGNSTLIPWTPLQPLQGKKHSKGRKKSKQLPWAKIRESLTDTDSVSAEMHARMRSHSLIPRTY